MKFYIEHFEQVLIGDAMKGYQWCRVAGATATRLKDAEELKVDLAKVNREDIKNYSILIAVDGDLKGGARIWLENN